MISTDEFVQRAKLLFGTVIPESLASCGYTLPDEYHTHVQDSLLKQDAEFLELLHSIKADIQVRFNETLLAYQQKIQQANKKNEHELRQALQAKNVNQGRIDKINEELAQLMAEARTLKEPFMDARRLEEYFRTIPSTYQHLTRQSVNDSLRRCTYVDYYNPTITVSRLHKRILGLLSS